MDPKFTHLSDLSKSVFVFWAGYSLFSHSFLRTDYLTFLLRKCIVNMC